MILSVYLFGKKNEQGRYRRRKTDGLLHSIKLAECLNLSHVRIIDNQLTD
jgi:hypothetical protein